MKAALKKAALKIEWLKQPELQEALLNLVRS